MNFKEIIKRSIEVFGFKTQKELAELLGIDKNNLSNKIKVGVNSALLAQIIDKIIKTHPEVDLDWLIHGRDTPADENKPLNLKQLNRSYDELGGWQAGPFEEFCSVPKGMGFIRAIDALADIFRTEDKTLIDKTVDTLNSLRDSAGMDDAVGITYIDPAVRIMNEILREENADLDADELAAVLEMLRGSLEKPKSNTINLIRAFKKGDVDGGRET